MRRLDTIDQLHAGPSARRLIILPEPERLAVMHQLPAPITYYEIECDRPRLAWSREWADRAVIEKEEGK